MGFVKKNPFCSAFLVLAAVVFGALVFLYLQEQKKVNEAKTSLDRQVSQLRAVDSGVPYPLGSGETAIVFPSAENLETLRERLSRLDDDLGQIEESVALRAENYFQPPASEFTFLPKIQGYINEFEERAESGEPPIELADNLAFGFRSYAGAAETPPEAFIPILDKQKQILAYVLELLYAAGPSRINAVRREPVELANLTEQARQERLRGGRGDFFQINELVTAETDFIDTLAFELVFEGYTDTLRQVLNGLARFELPIVVRAIEVRPAEIRFAGQRRASSPDDIFGVFEMPEGEAETESENASREPVLTQIASEFRVVLEYIEVDTGGLVDELAVTANEEGEQ